MSASRRLQEIAESLLQLTPYEEIDLAALLQAAVAQGAFSSVKYLALQKLIQQIDFSPHSQPISLDRVFEWLASHDALDDTWLNSAYDPNFEENHCKMMNRLAQLVLETAADKTQFVPNALQKAILEALDSRALKKQPLADVVCGGDGSRLYRPYCLKELIECGLVEHKRNLGFYRPDKPPT